MTKNESEKVDTEICEDFAHLAIGIHGPIYHFSRDSRQQQRSRQHCGLYLLLTLYQEETS